MESNLFLYGYLIRKFCKQTNFMIVNIIYRSLHNHILLKSNIIVEEAFQDYCSTCSHVFPVIFLEYKYNINFQNLYLFVYIQ